MSKKKALSFAVAACSFALQLGEDNIATVQVTPAGVFHPADGRKINVPGWKIDAASARGVIDKFHARKTPLVVDYEHQTLRKDENGQPAPAAAWFKDLQWVEGKGLFATVELTARAKQAVHDREYRYFSPLFRYHPVTGEVLALEMGALTNTPAIDGMDELAVRAAASFGASQPENDMTLLQVLISALGLAADANEEQAVAELNARLSADPLSDIKEALGLDEKTDPKTLVAACTALKDKNPDPGKYVPVSVLTEVQGQIAELNQKLAQRDQSDLESMISAALEDGRLLKPMEKWARDLGKSDMASLSAYLDNAKPFADLAASQTHGNPPQGGDSKLTADELAVCSCMGLTEEEFLKAKSD